MTTTSIKPVDLHCATLVPVGAHCWAMNNAAAWMVRTDRLPTSLRYRADDFGMDRPLSEFKATKDASVLLCTVEKVLVPVPGNARTVTSEQLTKIISLPVPKKVWGQSQFFFESPAYLADQASVFTCGDKAAVFNRTYAAQVGAFGDWHGDDPAKPFFIVDKKEVVAIIMPIRTGAEVPRFVFGPVDDLAS